MSSISNFEKDVLNNLIQKTKQNHSPNQFPNPNVGAVVIQNEQIISEGFHQVSGEDHAEVIALKKAGEKARGATILITLEPCTHTGQTPPCVEAIKQYGISRVIWAVNDPNPTVESAKQWLNKHNIECIDNVMPEEGRELIKEFYTYHSKKRPYFYLKLAVSNDGMLAPNREKLTYISSDASRDNVQQLRQRCQVILVGVDTINIDHPSLSIRNSTSQQPAIAIIDPNGTLSNDWLTEALSDNRTIILFTKPNHNKTISQPGLFIHEILSDNKSENWVSIAKVLYKEGYQTVLVEGGSKVAASLLAANIADECWIYNVTKNLAGPQSVPFIIPESARSNWDRMTIQSVEDFSGDQRTIYKNPHAI